MSTIQIQITEVNEITPELMKAMERLLLDLKPEAIVPSEEQIREILECPATRLLVARSLEKDSIVGMLTLIIFRVPSGIRAWIENFVVDELARGKGIGKALLEKALALSQHLGAASVDLTSRPIKEREVANRLYLDLGFEKRETVVYRFTNW